MSQPPRDPLSYDPPRSPFTKVIATRYYDVPLAGFLAHREWNQACLFRLLDWDDTQDRGVFEIARVEDHTFESIVSLLFEERLPTWPLWVLQSGERERGEKLLEECFARSRPVAKVSTEDLLGEIMPA